MNGTYYANPTFPTSSENNDLNIVETEKNDLTLNELLTKNKGKKIKICLSFPNYKEETILSGRLEKIAYDYLIINDIVSDEYKIILLKYINYISFIEKI